jgi:hypothetical protein
MVRGIDDQTHAGLSSTSNSLAYTCTEIERHFHSYERWFETAAVAVGETHVADAAGTGGGVFQVDAGNDDWGSWLQILGSEDTPAITGSAKFDIHRIEITAAERNEIYVIQFAFGESGAAALSAGAYTESPFKPASNLVDSGPIVFQSRRQSVGTKAWARCICPGQNTATIDFMFGLHEYEG